jgi:orotate phosphoribosyltransferase
MLVNKCYTTVPAAATGCWGIWMNNGGTMTFGVDDVYTTGKSIRAMERIIRTTGARVSARIVIANRSEKALKSVRSLVDVAELL